MGKRVVAVGAMKGRASGVSTIGLEVVKIVMVSIRGGGTKTQSAVATGSQAVHGSTTQPAVASGISGTKTQPAVATGSQAIHGSTTQPKVASGIGGPKTKPAVAAGSQAIDGSDTSQL